MELIDELQPVVLGVIAVGRAATRKLHPPRCLTHRAIAATRQETAQPPERVSQREGRRDDVEELHRVPLPAAREEEEHRHCEKEPTEVGQSTSPELERPETVLLRD